MIYHNVNYTGDKFCPLFHMTGKLDPEERVLESYVAAFE